MKVYLNGEFGIVIKSETANPNFHGVIRWDTEKEIDCEDWTGLFGTFLSLGGEIIDEKHQFNYINYDGTLKSKDN